MESIGAISEGDWSSLSGMYTTEEADFMAQLLGTSLVPTELDGRTSLENSLTFWPSRESTMNMACANEGSCFSLEIANSSSYCFSQASTCSSGRRIFPSSSQDSFCLTGSHPIFGTNNNHNNGISMDFCAGDPNDTSSYFIDQGDECLNQDSSDGNVDDQSAGKQSEFQPKRESETQASEPATADKLNNPPDNSKKRSRNTTDVQKNMRNVKSTKKQKTVSSSNNEENSNNNNNNNNNNYAGANMIVSSNCCLDDDSNISQDLNGGESSSMSSKAKAALNLNGKTRASRGSATDPQSLYAKKRRERINERLRILQNLVPNGTKVDISTMLEEAVQYVQFLQLQIKLLSSDKLWMYAPIAYNGMNIGLDHLKLAASKLS